MIALNVIPRGILLLHLNNVAVCLSLALCALPFAAQNTSAQAIMFGSGATYQRVTDHGAWWPATSTAMAVPTWQWRIIAALLRAVLAME